MGMTTHIVGYRPEDEKWHQMKAVWDACVKAGTDTPHEVVRFFDGMPPESKCGLEVDISNATREYQTRGVGGHEVDISKLPKDVSIIRFYKAY